MPALVLTRTGLGLTDYAVRLIVIGLTVLLILIQYPLWLGKGSWLRVWDLSRQLDSALVKEQELRERNAKLASEVQDLKEGTGALEERARYELGLIKDNETFVQILEGEAKKTAPTAPTTPSTAKP
ncbi:COG2919 Septum formation initiator [Oxalobacteraceae bacterium]|jgi:cell division protein FtsB